MSKYEKMFNELLLTAETKKVKKGGGMAAVLKLISDLTEFENNIQEAIDAQDIADYKTQIQAFLTDIDKMYTVLFDMAKTAIQSMRSERVQFEQEVEQIPERQQEPAPVQPENDDFKLMNANDLKNALKAVPGMKIPEPPKKV